eukprot:scaffold45021_cov20-Tisochrysis_lutea.AAC.2
MGPARRVTQINKLDRQTGRQAVLLGLVDAQLFWQLSSTFIHGSISVARVEAGPLNYLCLPWAIGEVKARWESKDRASTGSGTIADPGTFACQDQGRELGDSQVPDVQPVRGPYYPQPRSPAMPSRSSSEPWL